jgi:hypothetical protein
MLMSEIVWQFDGKAFNDINEFETCVRSRQIDVFGHDDDWLPELVLIKQNRIHVLFISEVDGTDVEMVVELVSDTASGFSMLELLFKIHNSVVDVLKNNAHNYFEGLRLGESKFGFPLTYVMEVGS